MDKEKRKKIIWIAIIILVILGLLWLLLRSTDLYRPGSGDITNEIINIPVPSSNLQYDPDLPPAQTSTEFDIENLAKNFASRFGSWSTDNPGKNLQELLPLSTGSMQNYLQSININNDTDGFSGITTKSISSEILSVSDSDAEVMVGTQRVETNNNLEENVVYQDIKIMIVKSGSRWLVDGAYWQ
jgi:hypothetical protein